MFIKFPIEMKAYLPPKAQDAEANRSHALGLAGFSFTGVMALTVIDISTNISLRASAYYMLVSFLAFLWGLNIQSYKHFKWIDVFSDALMDVGSLGLVLALIAALWSQPLDLGLRWIGTSLASAVFLVDHCVRVRFDWIILCASTREKRHARKG
jgi:hypothetical protein